MSFNLFAQPTIDDIRVGYIDPVFGYVEGVTVCEANDYAKNNPGTTFLFRDGNNTIRYLNINEVNNLNPNDLVTTQNDCGGIQQYKKCGPPRIQFFGGGGVGAAGNPVIGRDGSLLAVDVVRGGHGYEYAPIVAAKDDCEFGNGAVLTAILGETPDQVEVFDGEEDFEDYQICEDTTVGYGINYGLNGEPLGQWEPGTYTKIGEDPIKREIEQFQKAIKKPFWTTRKFQPDRIIVGDSDISPAYDATFPKWGEFMNKYAVSPVKPSNITGSDNAAKLFRMEWEQNFPISGEYIFRGVCDNSAQLYIDDKLIGSLKGFDQNPSPLQKTIQEGNHIIRVDLLNVPITETITTTSSGGEVEAVFKVTGKGKNTNLMKFSFSSGGDTFTIKGNDKSKQTREVTVKLKPNSKYKITASSSKGPVEQGIIRNGTKNKEGGAGSSNKIFADHIDSDNDNDDMQISTNIGTFVSSNKRQGEAGRSTFDLVLEVPEGTPGETTTTQVISSKSWFENPMGVSMIIDAPLPPVPQEQPPVQTGRCPPNPIWTTRFPGSAEKWYPVRNKAWAKFFNRYAISPVLPLNTPGSDGSGIVHRNSWDIEIPYRGFYQFQVQRDNTARIYVDGNLAFDTTTSGDSKWIQGGLVNRVKTQKVFLETGRHTIAIELENTPQDTPTIIDTKIFSTQDWRSEIKEETQTAGSLFVKEGSSYYMLAGGNDIVDIKFVFDWNDNPFTAGTAVTKITIPTEKGSPVVLSRPSGSSKGSTKATGTFKANKKYGPIRFEGRAPGSDDPKIVDSGPAPDQKKQRINFFDSDGNDVNAKLTAVNAKQLSGARSVVGNQSKTKNGVTYEGPDLFGHQEKEWSKYMNDFSVSPKVFGSIGEPDGRVVGTHTLTWKGVNFSQGGTYKFNLQADNIATLIIDDTEIYKTSDFKGQKLQFTFDVSPGKHNISIVLENIRSGGGKNDIIFLKNPTGVALFISKDVIIRDSSKTSWTQNPMGISAILIPPPCAKKIGGRGVVDKVIVNDPGNGYLPPQSQGPDLPQQSYPVTLVLDEVIVEDPGINYSFGEDQIVITPSNGAELEYDSDPFGKIRSVKVVNPGIGFNTYPIITMPSDTGVNARFRPVFRVVRDPIFAVTDVDVQDVQQEALIQVTDLVGLKQTGYVDGRAYYGAVYYDEGIPYAGYYKTVGTQVRVYATLQESISAQVTTPPSAIQRSGTDIRSNDPRLNIPGTPESTTEQQ